MDRPLLGTETACAPPSCAGAQHRRRRGLKRGGGSHAGGKYKHGTTVACYLKLQPISYERGSCLAHRRGGAISKAATVGRTVPRARPRGANTHPTSQPRAAPWWPPTCRLRPPENPAHVVERAAPPAPRARPRGANAVQARAGSARNSVSSKMELTHPESGGIIRRDFKGPVRQNGPSARGSLLAGGAVLRRSPLPGSSDSSRFHSPPASYFFRVCRASSDWETGWP